MAPPKLTKVSSAILIEDKADLERLRGKYDFGNLYKLLKKIKSYDMSRELLVETLIGKSLTPLSVIEAPADRKDLEEEAQKVRKISSDILNSWKKVSKPPQLTPKPSSECTTMDTTKSEEVKEESNATDKLKIPYIPKDMKFDT